MTFKTTLEKALKFSHRVSVDEACQGVLFEAAPHIGGHTVIFAWGDGDYTIEAELSQEIEVDSGGIAKFEDLDGAEHEVEFEVVHRFPLREDHIK